MRALPPSPADWAARVISRARCGQRRVLHKDWNTALGGAGFNLGFDLASRHDVLHHELHEVGIAIGD
ncbi:hypothetical protein GCM10011492_39730 [Flexivirga endophytica]|uniref:Uncharacterized protein n=1 Tax=Flexivirga endophytica TaxID=1849103 RepID=A0A916TJU1_9MICO|nr:hypothetical protein GCM10011492_39730 [Flexivirga endophytica]GHB68631.1 hypothetical protein GCM10008112_41630 [Flexivirga endophytica]